MRSLPFVKSSPCGNTTILIRNTPLSPALRALAAAEMMAPDHLQAEQVGFVDTVARPPRLDMMGGEFCLNATRSLAALLLSEGKLAPAPVLNGAAEDGRNWHEGLVSVSGMPVPLHVRARFLDEGCCVEAGVLLELPKAPVVHRLEEGLYEARVPGITHLVLDADVHPLPEDPSAETRTRLADAGLLSGEAAGCIWLHGLRDLSEQGEAAISPFVWVRDTGSICAETACGSGTLAAALVASTCVPGTDKGGNSAPERLFRQPGGETLSVRFCTPGKGMGWAAHVTGAVRTLAAGEVFVHCL